MELVIAIVITIVACAVVVYAVVSGFALLDIRRVRRFYSDANADVRTTPKLRVSHHQTVLYIHSRRTVN